MTSSYDFYNLDHLRLQLFQFWSPVATKSWWCNSHCTIVRCKGRPFENCQGSLRIYVWVLWNVRICCHRALPLLSLTILLSFRRLAPSNLSFPKAHRAYLNDSFYSSLLCCCVYQRRVEFFSLKAYVEDGKQSFRSKIWLWCGQISSKWWRRRFMCKNSQFSP